MQPCLRRGTISIAIRLVPRSKEAVPRRRTRCSGSFSRVIHPGRGVVAAGTACGAGFALRYRSFRVAQIAAAGEAAGGTAATALSRARFEEREHRLRGTSEAGPFGGDG